MCPAFGCGARRWPLAIMLSADRVPVKSTRSRAPWRQWVVPGPWPTGMGALQVFALSNFVARITPRVLDSYADNVARYGSPLAIIAQAIRAILLASATAATLADRRSISFTNHGWRV